MEFEPYPHYVPPQERITSLETELTVARAEIERLRDVLRQVQWGNEYINFPAVLMCPLCDQVPENGHAPDCLVGMCLEEK
jgi:hypothetical protein